MTVIYDITIIYNPNSTGDGEVNAKQLKKQLKSPFKVSLVPTEYAGHAQEITNKITKNNQPHIILSSSGDGGYNEVINGVLEHKNHDHIVTGIIPSGNANDHYNELSTNMALADRIKKQAFFTIDTLHLSTNTLSRYAHSYIGFGVTPHIGEKLTKATLNPINEVWIVVKNIFTVRPVKIVQNGKVQRYDNLLFSNIGTMSKVIKLTENASLTDGKFEIVSNKSRSIGTLVKHLFRASTVGLNSKRRASRASFKLVRKASVQLDGEVIQLPGGSRVTIASRQKSLRCVA